MRCGEITLIAAPLAVYLTLGIAPDAVNMTLKGCDMGETRYEHFAPSDADDFYTSSNKQFVVVR